MGDGSGILVSLFDDGAAVSIPFWHSGAEAVANWNKVWQYLRIIQHETGYFAFDHQLGVILDLDQSYEQALRLYTGTRDVVTRELPGVVFGNQADATKK